MPACRPFLAAALATSLAVLAGCPGRTALEEPPAPADLDALDVALAEWIWKLGQAQAAKPDDERSYLNLCLLYQENGLGDLARECLDRLTAARPGNAQAWYHLAGACQAAGDLAGAIAALERTVERAAHYTPAWLRLGDRRLEAGDAKRAAEAYAVVLERDPGNVPALVGAARVALARDEPQTTLVLVDRALSASPGHALASSLRLEAESRIDPGKPAPPPVGGRWLRRSLGDDPWAAERQMFWVGYDARLDVADDYRSAGDADTALSVLEALLSQYPDDLGLHLRLATLHQLGGRHATALEHIERVVLERPDSPIAHARHGAILRSLQRLDEALDAFRYAEALDPGDAAVVRAVGDCALRSKRWDEAAAAYERAVDLEPASGEAYARLGLVYLRLQRLAQAEQTLVRALDLGVRRPEPLRLALEKTRQLLERDARQRGDLKR